jgi:hypothetical protein
LAVMDVQHDGIDFVNDTQLWLSPLGSAVASWSITPVVAVFGRADVVVPGTRRTFLTDFNQEVYKVPAIAARAAVGIEFRFY